MNGSNAAEATTGTVWIAGQSTEGAFVSCAIERRVKDISAAGRLVAVTLDDGGVQFIDLAGLSADLADDAGEECAFVAESWNPPEDESASSGVAATQTCLSSGSWGLMLSGAGEVFSWGGECHHHHHHHHHRRRRRR